MIRFDLKTSPLICYNFRMENSTEIKELLSQLNDEQIKPVLDIDGAVLVIAGAGSGKTRVLTTRIAYLVKEKKVNPADILAITFTNKAAGEMKHRLEQLVGNVADMWVSTIHSMCVRILRRDIEYIGYQKNFTIYDETDKDKVLKRVIEDLGFESDKLLKLAKHFISKAKNECLDPLEFKKEYADLKMIDEIFAVYDGYQRYLDRSNCLDFDDLLYKTYLLFNKFPDLAKYYASKFRYVHIDEFQDTNTVQFEIAQFLSSVHGNIFVVGDDDQSIYGWRGAKMENILNFDKIYADAKVYKLERNYRSTKKIIELANCIIKNNTGRREKQLWTENGDGAKIETFVGTDEMNEASYVALQIKNIMARNSSVDYKDFAVFMRLNALSRAFEQEFTKYGIPYVVYGGFRFFERKEIKDVLAYLKVINNTYDDESFIRSATCPRRGIGDKTLSEVHEFAVSRGMSVFDAIDYLELSDISPSSKKKLITYKNLVLSFIDYSTYNSPTQLINFRLNSTDFYLQFEEKTEENTFKKHNIYELINAAEQFEKANNNDSLSDFLNSVTLSSDTDSINDDNVVTIATIHSAKGLEYPIVFVTGCDEKILPSQRSFGIQEELEEERRLMYVAVTRARERLYLTRANSRYMYGGREYMMQSRFLKEAQELLFPNAVKKEPTYNPYRSSSYDNPRYPTRDAYQEEDFGSSSSSGYSSNYAKKFLSDNKPKVNTVNASAYKSGSKVRHTKFGEGIVISVKGEGDNIIVDVAFKGVGIKSLSAKYAPMEII